MIERNVVVCGSRTWTDRETIRAWLERLPRGARLAHGACSTGADAIAGELALELGFQVVTYPADWSEGAKGGPIRNATMLKTEKPSRVFAFALVDRNGVPTAGTDDCARRALQLGIPVTIIPPGARP